MKDQMRIFKKIALVSLSFFYNVTVLGATSAENRSNKNFAVEAATGHLYGKLSAGAHLVYFLRSKTTLDLNYTASKADYAAKYGNEIRFLGLGIRHFLGNSFNIRGGLGYLEARRNVSYWKRGSRDIGLVNVENDELIGELTLGNQWSFGSGMTIGFDWLGYYGSLTKVDSKVSVVKDVGELPRSLKNGIERHGRDSARDDALQMRLTGGFQF